MMLVVEPLSGFSANDTSLTVFSVLEKAMYHLHHRTLTERFNKKRMCTIELINGVLAEYRMNHCCVMTFNLMDVKPKIIGK
jgi:hypothetical protein